MGDVLPYITQKSIDENELVEMPELIGLSIKEAKEILTNVELDFEIDGESADGIIQDQLPKKGIKVSKGTKVILYTKEE